MSLSGCSECWNTPCTCGYEYRHWELERRIELAAKILGIDAETIKCKLPLPDKHPRAKET